jgi:hypothetical protein
MVGRFEEIRGLAEIERRIRALGKELGVGARQMQELFTESVAIGQIPVISALTDAPAADAFNQARYASWRQSLFDIGMSSTQVNTIEELVSEQARIFERVRTTARGLGVEVGDLDGLGYITRISTERMKLYWQNHPELMRNAYEISDDLVNGRLQMSTVFNKTRMFNHYIPEDSTLVTVKLWEYLQQSGKLTDVGTELKDLYDIVNDLPLSSPLEWRAFLEDINRADPSLLDDLIESGGLSKLPMTSREVFDFLVQQYDLPMKNVSDMFVTNPMDIVQEYTKELRRAAGARKLFDYVRNDGVNQGWAVPVSMIGSSADYNDFVDVNNYLKQLRIDVSDVGSLDGLAMHRAAADQLAAILVTTVSPARMAGFGQFIYKFNKMLATTTLGATNLAYASKVALGNFIGGLAATGLNPIFALNATRAYPTTVQVLREGTSFLDDTRRVYRLGNQYYSERELFNRLLTHRFTEVLPMTAGDVSGRVADFSNGGAVTEYFGRLASSLTGIGSALNYASAVVSPRSTRWQAFKHNPIRFIQEFGRAEAQALVETADEWLAPWSYLANLSDISAKYAILRTMLDPMHPVPREFKNWQELFEYIDEYIPSPDANGTYARIASAFIRPFSGFAMWNPPAQLRHAMRQPRQYINYHKIWALVDSAGSCGADAEAQYSSWQLDGYPVRVGCDANGDQIIIDPTNYDQIADAFVFARESGESVIRLTGGFAGSSEEQRNQLTGNAFTDALLGATNQTYWAPVLEQIFGIDTFTGRSFTEEYPGDTTSFLGLEMKPRVRALLESFAPLSRINRSNPLGMFGRRQVRDANGVIVTPETLSRFGARRSDNDRDTDSLDVAQRFFDNIGGNIRILDTDVQVQRNFRGLEADVRAVSSMLNKAQRAYDENYDQMSERERVRRRDELERMYESRYRMEYEVLRLQMFMEQNNIAPPELFELLEQAQTNENLRQQLEESIPHPEASAMLEHARRLSEALEGIQ